MRAAALALALFAGATAGAQLTVKNAVNPPYDPERLIRDVFLGDGVEVTGVTFDGVTEAVGYFEGGRTSVGLDRGILLTTGLSASKPGGFTGADAPGFANAQHDNGSPVRDPNLELIEPYQLPDGSRNLYNVARYTITFVPTGDRVRFRYVFASDEYPDFVCDEYNDIFGFFINGPGFSGPFANGAENIATIPGTSLPVTINSVNGGVAGTTGDPANCSGTAGSLANTAYYRDNNGSAQFPAYNGMTTVLTAEAAVVPCSTYTIHIVIGDVRDQAYDSGVFLEAKSFSTPTVSVDVETVALGGDISEGCADAQLVFRLNGALPVDRVVTYTVAGTATPGVDYSPLSGTAVIPAGDTFLSVPIIAFDDGVVEGRETIVFGVDADVCSTKSHELGIIDRTIPAVPALRDTVICAGAAVPLDATLAVSVDPPVTFSNVSPITLVTVGHAYRSTIDVTGVQPNELRNGQIFKVCIDAAHGRMNDLDIFLFGPNGNFIELTTDNGGSQPGSYGQLCFSPRAENFITDPAFGPHYNGIFQPEGPWPDLWNDASNPVNGTWTLQVTDDANGGFGTLLGWSITFEPLYDVSYAWSPAAGLSCVDCPNPVASPTQSTAYTVMATDSYGCTETSTAEIDIFADPTTPVVSCVAGFDELTFSWPADPAVLRFEVSDDGVTWRDIGLATSETLAGLGFGDTRTLRVRAVAGCSEAVGSSTCTTQACPAYSVTATVTDATCAGYADGSLVVVPGGGVAPYSYTVAGLTNATGVFAGLPAATYVVQVLDANGCAGNSTATVGEPESSSTVVDIAVPTACGGGHTLSASSSGGGGAPYTYTWSDGQTGPSAVYSAAGEVWVETTDAGGCRRRDSLEILAIEPLRAEYLITAISCAGAADGAAGATGAGGVAPYATEVLDAGGATLVASGLAPGSYRLRVTDAIGCSVDTTFALLDPSALSIAFTSTDVACNGAADGTLTATVSDARGALTYAWTGFPATDGPTLAGLSAGSYDLIVTDAAGCSATGTGVVSQPGTLAISTQAVDVSCFGESDGVIRVSRTGGVAPYTFDFGGGRVGVDSVASGLRPGDYTLRVIDGAGCSQTRVVSIAEPFELEAFHQQQPIRCAGETNASIDLNVSGGTTPYTYTWDDGATTEDRSDLAAGAYAVEIVDARGCRLDYGVEITEPQAIDLGATVGNVTCYGYDDGLIALAVTGGRAPYNFDWSGPGGYANFSATLGDLAPGVYDLDFRDAAGCRVTTSFEVVQPAAVAVATTVLDTICHGARDGIAQAVVTGGTAPFSYRWDNGTAAATSTGLPAGTHAVTVTDALGCTFVATAEVPQLPRLSMTLTQAPSSCYRAEDGAAEVVAAQYGARAVDPNTLTLVWRDYPAVTTPRITGLIGGEEAHLTLTDARGCTARDSIVIAEPDPLNVSVRPSGEVSCAGGNDGRAVATVTGGTPGYTFAWSGSAETGATAVALSAGEHSVDVVDANGCRESTTVTVLEPLPLMVELEADGANCFAPNTGRLRAAAAGGNAPYRYTWAHGGAGAALDSLVPGDYLARVTDARGCVVEDSIAITRAVAVQVSATPTAVTCHGDTDGSVALVASGGNAPYTYRVGSSPFVRFGDFRSLAPGMYPVVAKDRDGCPSEIDSVYVKEPQPVVVEAGERIAVEVGDSVELTARLYNATEPVQVRWSPADSSLFACATCATTVMYPNFQGNVLVQVVDARGCEAEDMVQVRVERTTLIRVPTGFTPDGNGRDDRLVVHGRSRTRVETFEVFDRWGALVYRAEDFLANDADAGWDGTARGGAAPAGLYVWRVAVRFLGGVSETYTGQTVLIR